MDDRDKAGDPDSNPEINDSDSESEFYQTASLPKIDQPMKRLKTAYLDNFKDPEDNNSVMIDKVTEDMGQRLANTMQNFAFFVNKAEKNLHKLIS